MKRSCVSRWPGSRSRPAADTAPQRALRPAAARAAAALALAAAAALGLNAAAGGAARQDGDTQRLIAVVGDLHMGAGRDAAGAWRPAADFRWADELEGFLQALDAAGAGAADLVLNGDTFELASAECVRDDPALGCTEAEALAVLERVLAAHPRAIDALAAFARAGSNRVVLVPGDHDAALLFPAVRARAEAALGAPRARVAAAGAWTSSDGQVHAEHGHQIGWRADRFADWPAPFVERDGRRHLERPPGARLVAALLEEHEARYPVVDNFADAGAGLTHALAAADVAELGAAAPDLLRYVLFRMPWQQFRVDLDIGDVQPPAWDLAAVRAQGPAFLVDSLPDDDRFKPLARRALEADALGALMSALGDEELTALCDYRAAARRARRRFERYLTQFDPRGSPVAECPRLPDSRGGQFDYFWRTRDLIYGRRLGAVQAGLPDRGRPIAVFVHGHTHLVDWRQRVLLSTSQGRPVVVDGFSPVRNALTPIVINGGAWQRTLTPVQFLQLQEAGGLSDVELLRALRPEHLAPCYSFVQVDPYEGTPAAPVVRYWRQAEGGAWELAGECGREPTLPSGGPR